MRSDFKDITGQVFGRLTALYPIDDGRRILFWRVQCECGHIGEVAGTLMRTGRTKSCGCLQKDAVSKPHKFVDGKELKHCSYCDTWLDLSSFCKATGRIDGLASTCSECKNGILRKYRKENPEKAGEWARENLERCRENVKNYRKANPEWWKEWNLHHAAKPHNRIRTRMSAMMRYCLKQNKDGKPWESLVGYTLSDLRKHLSKTMPKGYTWDDLDKLHIDHIIPITAFNIEDENSIDFYRCWGLKNLRLLPAMENMKKNAKLTKPFQPSLAMPVVEGAGWL